MVGIKRKSKLVLTNGDGLEFSSSNPLANILFTFSKFKSKFKSKYKVSPYVYL